MIIKINMQSNEPIYEQIRAQIIFGISSKQLLQGEPLPSVRNLAAQLGINYHTVSKAYSMLAEEGYLVTTERRGVNVARGFDKDHNFEAVLTRALTFEAARARCRDVDSKRFMELCLASYQAAAGNANNN